MTVLHDNEDESDSEVPIRGLGTRPFPPQPISSYTTLPDTQSSASAPTTTSVPTPKAICKRVRVLNADWDAPKTLNNHTNCSVFGNSPFGFTEQWNAFDLIMERPDSEVFKKRQPTNDNWQCLHCNQIQESDSVTMCPVMGIQHDQLKLSTHLEVDQEMM